ncbi:helicase-related protein [Oceanicoccus sagamiensis]|uniref:helicase-related protein n=1 Tax=Oceanicoccus sagamiensis TaxID=716816 RepID=UPI003B832312
MPKPIRKVADRYLNDPKEVRIASESTTAAKIEQSYLIVNGFERKLDAITRILEADSFDAMIIFVRTKTATAELAEKLEARGYSASALNGDMNQALRERTINRLKKKQLDIIVATDVAARGIDVERVSHVLNFDIPYDPEAYVHRIGRTGRAGREGKAILFVAPREKRLLQAIEKATRKPIAKMDLPSGVEVSNRRIEHFKQQLTETLENQNLDFFHNVLSEYSIEADRSAEDIACALAYLLQKEKPLEVKDEPKPKKPRDSFDKPERNDNRKSARKREEGKRNKSDINMVRYRIEVGREDGVTPGNIVGAIANETGIDGEHIGHIKLHDNHSTVDLPEGMPKDMLNTLKKVRICNKTIFMSEEGKADHHGEKATASKKKKGKSNASDKSKAKDSTKKDKPKSKSKVKKRKAK